MPSKRAPALICVVSLLGVLAGCNRSASCEVLDSCADELPTETMSIPVPTRRDIDVLFVIDNSGSMGEEQARLAASVGAFIEVLEDEDVNANYRIGVTTTDNGNLWCPDEQTSPEAGRLVLSSCKERLDEFTFDDFPGVQDLACNDICTLDADALEILPTTTSLDPEPKPRPWLERIDGQKNIPASTDTAAAFACFGPQGIRGCGFESPLESMTRALDRAADVSEASYGFMRQGATLAVVFVTDEADCSHVPAHEEIFDSNGDRVFWSDPAATFPSSAVCWNASVACTGDPSGYDACEPVNKDVDGNVGVADAAAVLHPIARYIDRLESIEEAKRALDPSSGVIVALIGGVRTDGTLHYAEVGDTDPDFQDTFGIGPGCEAQDPLDPQNPAQAVPPVRLRVLIDTVSPGNLHSICAPDYSPALAAIAQAVSGQRQPACFEACVADTNVDTELVEPSCTVEQDLPGAEGPESVPECLRDADGYVIDPETQDFAMPGDDVDVCHALRVDTDGLSVDPADDISAECAADKYNLELVIARRPGPLPPNGTSMTATCVRAEDPARSCG